MSTLSVELSDTSLGLLQGYAAAKRLPPEGVMTLAILDMLETRHPGHGIETVPCDAYLAEIADHFDKSPPSTPEEAARFAERLRYVAQFCTTQRVPKFNDAPEGASAATAQAE